MVDVYNVMMTSLAVGLPVILIFACLGCLCCCLARRQGTPGVVMSPVLPTGLSGQPPNQIGSDMTGATISWTKQDDFVLIKPPDYCELDHSLPPPAYSPPDTGGAGLPI